jgi:hypothetical protein
MGGFVPDCHTQTFVEVAKSENFMIEIPSAIGLLIVLYFCTSGKPSKRKQRFEQPTKADISPITKEVKSLYNRGASCAVYGDGTVKAFSFHYGKGGYSITQDQFNSLDFHATDGGVWKKEIRNADGTLKEVIDLMPTLNLTPPPLPTKKPTNIHRGDYLLEFEAHRAALGVIQKAAEGSRRIVHVSPKIKALLRAILFIKKVLGIRRNFNDNPSSQPNKNSTKYFEWKRITLEDIDRLWRESGKLDATFRDQLRHFAHGVESILKSNTPDEYRLYWQTISQDDIDRQWVVSFSVHPAFGRQLCHFATGVERIVVKANSK